MKYFTSILIRVFIILFFVACGGDNSQIDSNTTIIEQERSISLNESNYTETTVKIPDNIIGVVQKGLFIDGTIKAQYIDKDGELSKENVVGDIDNKGTYSLYLKEDGLVSLKAKGKFFNEYRGENSTEEAELFALFEYKKSDNIQKINLNLFSSLEYRRVLTLMQEGDNFQKALESTRVSMKTIFGLSKESKTTDLDIYDLNGTLKDENINLLLLSGAFLKSIDSESSISKQSKIVEYQKGSTGDELDDFLSKFGTKGSMTGSSNWNRMKKYDMGVLFTQMASNLDLGYEGEDYEVGEPYWGYTPPVVVVGNPVVIGGGGVRNPPPPPPADTTSFITTWKTDKQGASNDNEIIISTKGSGYNYDIDWTGDGTWDTIGATGTQRHAYSQAGTYTVKIRGQFPRIYSDYQADRLKILSIEQWGNIEWQSMEEAFSGSKNLKINATDAPDLSRVTNMNNMLINTAINMEDLSSWDVSHVTTMINLFSVTNFNGDIRNWDVSSVTNMSYMFGSAKIFDQDIGDWNVSSVTDMLGMFNFAENFNQDISRWDVSHVQSMNSMFRFTNRFDQDISRWDTHNVTNMGQMFASAINFNQDISRLDISSVINMSGMFSRATKFDQDISRWNISNVQDMTAMFLDSRLSTANYDALLESWSTQLVQANILFHGGLSKYCRAKSARESLINAHGWTISDGGEDCNNHAPTITSTNSIPIEENRRVVLTIVGEDIDGDSLTYSIIGGVDQDKFNIDPTLGTLSFTIIPDFENSVANYSNNMYEVKVQVTDPQGLSATQTLFVSILDDPDESNTLSPTPTIALDLVNANDTGFSHVDNNTKLDTLTFEFPCPQPNSVMRFYFEHTLYNHTHTCQSSGLERITIPSIPHIYMRINYTQQLSSSSSESAYSPTLLLTVDTIAPNTPTLTTPTNGATVEGTAEAGTIITAKTTSNSNCITRVDANGDYRCTLSPTPVNFEALEVISTDIVGNSSPKARGKIRGVSLSNHPPVITSEKKFTFTEGADIGVAVANINAQDPDGDVLIYSLIFVEGGCSLDYDKFTITESGTLYFRTSPDYEFPINFDKDNIYQVNVKVTDNREGEAYSLVNITVRDSVRIKDTTFTPEKYANDVEIDSDISIQFIGKTIARGTGSIKIFKKNGDEEHTNFDVNVAQVTVLGDSLIIDPNADFEPETEYYILIDKGAIKDTNGVDYIGITNKEEWKFTTGKAPEPENPCGCPDFACFVN